MPPAFQAPPSWCPAVAHPRPQADRSARFTSASSSRQHPAKTRTGIPNADVVTQGSHHLGICDGVSGVFHLGIMPDELPRHLMQACSDMMEAAAVTDMDSDDEERLDHGTWLTNLIQEAYDRTTALGASTLLLTALRESNLITACIGDCALMVLRPVPGSQPVRLRMIFKTEPGRYDSRRPVQVQRLPHCGESSARQVIQGAMVSTTPILPGDMLVLGSDGLFDNLPDAEIKLVLEQCCSGAGLGRLAAADEDAIRSGPLAMASQALVDRAIARVKLDRGEPAARAPPWQGQNAEVPGTNADDTTALVAIVLPGKENNDAEEAVAAERPPAEQAAVAAAADAAAHRALLRLRPPPAMTPSIVAYPSMQGHAAVQVQAHSQPHPGYPQHPHFQVMAPHSARGPPVRRAC